MTASVNPASGPALVRANIPAAPRFDATLFVSATSLNLREAPSTGARVLTSLPRNTKVLAGERRGGWILVSANGQVGWVSGDYLSGTPAAPVLSVPAQSQPRQQVVQQPNARSCPSRRYCSQIGSCEEARWYLANCSWGHRLDGDGDGVPCENICR
ncbi:SH3 domain-containing protein [Devosia sp.]|uniref:SH3 domain-containing protein n=1 Tax=Devosia sp. TaxID=1871048 RepID=UPI002FCA23CA